MVLTRGYHLHIQITPSILDLYRWGTVSGRNLSTSMGGTGHYQVLSIPQNATKSQIKSSFYKFSKLYHPDKTSDPAAKEKFQKVSEAYAVLGDDRKRRAYDRVLSQDVGSRHHPAHHTSYTQGADHWAYEARRRPGATHAWDRSRRPGHRTSWGSHPNYSPPPPGRTPNSPPADGQASNDPFTSANVRRSTGRTHADQVNNISTFWRTAQVLGVVMVVATIGGGWSARA